MTTKEAILYMILYRQRLINSVGDLEMDIKAYDMAIAALERERKFLEAGYKNEEVKFYVGGRKFVVREIAQ